MARPVVHFEICARDAQKAHDFYKTLFDWKINAAEGMPYHLVESAGDGSIPGGIYQTDGKDAFTTFYVQVDDVQACLDHAVKLGGEIKQPPGDIPGVGTSARFTDPDGNLIGLFKPAE